MTDPERKTKILEDLLYKYIHFISGIYKISGGYSSKVSGKKAGHYGFIPSSTNVVIATLLPLYDRMSKSSHQHGIRFLDIGCGIGNVVETARKIGFDAYGLEYNTKICNVARKFIGKYHIIKGNMLTFKNYHEYDVLYYYQPMPDGKTMYSFAANKLAKDMKIGAYVVPIGSDPFRDMESFKNLYLGGSAYTYEKIAEV